MAVRQSWITCKYSFSSRRKTWIGDPVREAGLFEAYYCRNKDILNLGIYTTNESGLKAELFDIDDFPMGEVDNPKVVSNSIKRALVGCMHCRFYERK